MPLVNLWMAKRRFLYLLPTPLCMPCVPPYHFHFLFFSPFSLHPTPHSSSFSSFSFLFPFSPASHASPPLFFPFLPLFSPSSFTHTAHSSSLPTSLLLFVLPITQRAHERGEPVRERSDREIELEGDHEGPDFRRFSWGLRPWGVFEVKSLVFFVHLCYPSPMSHENHVNLVGLC